MGFEWQGQFAECLSEADVAPVLDAVSCIPGLEVLERQQRTIRFRFSDSPPRSEWPDDVQLDISQVGLTVLLHGAAHRGEELLAHIGRVLAVFGIACSFRDE